MSKLELSVWWVAQVPMAAFRYPVASFEVGSALVDALGKYDLFQFENNIRASPNYVHPPIAESMSRNPVRVAKKIDADKAPPKGETGSSSGLVVAVEVEKT